MNRIGIIVITLALNLSTTGYSRTMIAILGGYSQSTLNRGEDETFGNYPVLGLVGYSYGQWSAHGYFQTAQLGYFHNEQGYNGIFSAYGLSGAWHKPWSPTSRVSVFLNLPVHSQLILLSETEASVNDFTYKHSTVSVINGGFGYQILAGYEKLILGTGRQTQGGNLYYGGFLGYYSHAFDRKNTRIKTNNSQLAPETTGTEAVKYQFSNIMLYFSIINEI